jgi:hypothetical protein
MEIFFALSRRDPRNLTVAVKAAVDQVDAEGTEVAAAVQPLYGQLASCAMAFSMHPDRELREAVFAVSDAAAAVAQAHLGGKGDTERADETLLAALGRFRSELERSTKIRPRRARSQGAQR